VHLLSDDKIVPAERPAGREAGMDADLEVKRSGQARNRKWLQPESGRIVSLDQTEIVGITLIQTRIEKQPEGKDTAITGPRSSTYIYLPKGFSSHYLPRLVPPLPIPPLCFPGHCVAK
jgi:hypothetical protein